MAIPAKKPYQELPPKTPWRFSCVLLPTGSGESGVLGIGSIPVALLSCQFQYNDAFQLHKK